MAEPMAPARRRAFLDALEQTGNITVACARAKVSRSWVRLHKGRDPAFRDTCDAAVAAARERLQAPQRESGLPKQLRFLAGEELVVRGAAGRRALVARARVKQWTASVERVFLERLRATCSVTRACAAVGLSVQSAYQHRARWPAFAERWQEAIEDGYIELEFAAFESACASLEALPLRDDERVERISFDEALMLLSLHRKTAHGLPKPIRCKPATREETNAVLLKAIGVLERKEARDRRKAEAEKMRRG